MALSYVPTEFFKRHLFISDAYEALKKYLYCKEEQPIIMSRISSPDSIYVTVISPFLKRLRKEMAPNADMSFLLDDSTKTVVDTYFFGNNEAEDAEYFSKITGGRLARLIARMHGEKNRETISKVICMEKRSYPYYFCEHIDEFYAVKERGSGDNLDKILKRIDHLK